MNKYITNQMQTCIEEAMKIAERKKTVNNIIVFPCGDIGSHIIKIMKEKYSVEPAFLIDNNKYMYSDKIHDISFLDKINANEYAIIIASVKMNIYSDLKNSILKYFSEDSIVELKCMKNSEVYSKYETKIGKYSYGPLCRNHILIKSIGAFCSFAIGCDYVSNHEFRYISTHPFLYRGKSHEGMNFSPEIGIENNYYFPGVEPKSEMIRKHKRATIGNDVWLGRNVIVTNCSNIGNGVIAAAGSIITKDVPDYAVVAGVPARIIRYRYQPDEIEALNKIAWWDWSDDIIRERFDDFYLPVKEFIEKYSIMPPNI